MGGKKKMSLLVKNLTKKYGEKMRVSPVLVRFAQGTCDPESIRSKTTDHGTCPPINTRACGTIFDWLRVVLGRMLASARGPI